MKSKYRIIQPPGWSYYHVQVKFLGIWFYKNCDIYDIMSTDNLVDAVRENSGKYRARFMSVYVAEQYIQLLVDKEKKENAQKEIIATYDSNGKKIENQ